MSEDYIKNVWEYSLETHCRFSHFVFGTESNSTEPLFISVHIREDPGTEPDHTVGLKLFALELRLDYMGTGVLMCRVSSLAVSLRDEWKINHSKKTAESFIPTGG